MMKKKLIERWALVPELKSLVIKIDSLLSKGKFQSEIIPFKLIDGKLDLRGLNISGKELKKVEIKNANFTFSSFADCWIENSLFEKCYFEKVDFSSFSDHKNIFKECYFKSCKFSNASIGHGGSEFSNCEFEDCNFLKAIFVRAEFINVIFKNSRINNIDFNASSFENCSFEGELRNIWFRGGFPLESDISYFGVPKKNEMKNVSFINAELHDLTFSDNCDLSTIKIKYSDRYYVYDKWKERLSYLKSNILNWNEREKKEAEIFINVYSVHAKKQDWQIINIDDIERDYGKEVAFKIVSCMDSF